MKAWNLVLAFVFSLLALILPIKVQAQEVGVAEATAISIGTRIEIGNDQDCFVTGTLQGGGQDPQQRFSLVGDVYRNVGLVGSPIDPPLGQIQTSETVGLQNDLLGTLIVWNVWSQGSDTNRQIRLQYPAGLATVLDFKIGDTSSLLYFSVGNLPQGTSVRLLAQGGSGDIVVVKDLAIVRCYAKTVVQPTPTPTPIIEQLEDDSSVVIEELIDPANTRPDQTNNACFQTMLPAVTGSQLSAVNANSPSIVENTPLRSELGIIDGCISPSMILPCPNPVRVNVVKDDTNQGWGYEVRCNGGLSGTSPVFLGNVQAVNTGIGPSGVVAGILGIAASTYVGDQLKQQLSNFYWKPQSQPRDLGEIAVASDKEAVDWVLGQALVPGTVNFPEPLTISRIVEVDEETGESAVEAIIRWYRPMDNLDPFGKVYLSNVANYPMAPPSGVIGILQYVYGDGSKVIGVKSIYITLDRPSVVDGETDLLDVYGDFWNGKYPLPPEVKDVKDPFYGPKLDENGRPILNEDGDPITHHSGNVQKWRRQLAIARVMFGEIVDFLKRGKTPCDSLLHRPSDGACACVCYLCNYINGFGEVITGLAVIMNGNPTVVDSMKTNGSYDPLTEWQSESARPRKNVFSQFDENGNLKWQRITDAEYFANPDLCRSMKNWFGAAVPAAQ